MIRAEYERKYRYAGVVACIDGTYITMTAPLEQAQRYVDRHDDYSILVQAVADVHLLHRDVHIVQPGSVGDNRTYDPSPLSGNLLRRTDLLGEDEHLLGD